MASKLQKPPIIPSMFFMLGLAILLSLGLWQVSRYFEKLELEKACTVYFSDDGTCDPSVLEGKFVDGPVIAVQPRLHNGQSGYHIYKPFQLENTKNDPIIYVNLGWSEIKNPEIKPYQIKLEGRMLPIKGRNAFSLLPELEQNNWYAFDFTDLNTAYESEKQSLQWLDGYVLYTTFARYRYNNAEILEPYVPPEVKTTTLTPSTHMQYAFFWFAMALVMSVIFVLRFMRRT